MTPKVRGTTNRHVKRTQGIESPVFLACPPEQFFFKDQYFNMQDHPVFIVQRGDGGRGSHELKPGKHVRTVGGSTDATLPRV